MDTIPVETSYNKILATLINDTTVCEKISVIGNRICDPNDRSSFLTNGILPMKQRYVYRYYLVYLLSWWIKDYSSFERIMMCREMYAEQRREKIVREILVLIKCFLGKDKSDIIVFLRSQIFNEELLMGFLNNI